MKNISKVCFLIIEINEKRKYLKDKKYFFKENFELLYKSDIESYKKMKKELIKLLKNLIS